MKTANLLATCLAAGAALTISACNPSGIDRSGGDVVPPADAPPPATPTPSDALSLAAEAEKSSYVVGEPVYLTLALRNTGREAKRVLRRLDPVVGSVEIVVTGPDGDSVRFVPLGQVDTGPGMLVSLAPGEAVANVVPIFFGAGGWTFGEPGRYSVTATYEGPGVRGQRETARAGPTTVRVEEVPRATLDVGPENDAAFEAGKFLLWQKGDHLEEGHALLRAFAERAPDAVLTDYINIAFARSYADSFMDYRREAVRLPDCERARSHLSAARPGDVGGYARIQYAIAGLRCAVRRGDRDAAERYLDLVRETAGEDPAYGGLVARASELAGGLGADAEG